jgi:hypothetical protein
MAAPQALAATGHAARNGYGRSRWRHRDWGRYGRYASGDDGDAIPIAAATAPTAMERALWFATKTERG